MQTIIRFGTKKGFQAFPSLASFGSIGNELGTEQGLYLPASIIQSHARLVQERGAQGIERCLIYSKRSSLQRYHVLALIVPIDMGKPEWRDGAFVGVAMFAHGQIIREKEALAVLESELKELLTQHPISGGQAEGAEPLNWKVSSRSVPISLFSPWRDDFQARSAQFIPAFKANEPWHQRVSTSFESIGNLERAIILPLHESAPNISGWSAPGSSTSFPHQQSSESEAITSTPPNAVSVPNDDIKRLSSALEREQELNEELSQENKRLKTANNQKSRKQITMLITVSVVAVCLGVGIGWILRKNGNPVSGEGKEQIESYAIKVFGNKEYYFESLVLRSMYPKALHAKKDLGFDPAFIEYALADYFPVDRATLGKEGSWVGSYFFEKRYDDLKGTLENNDFSFGRLDDELLCVPCLKYGIVEYQSDEPLVSTLPTSFEQMIDTLKPNLTERGIEFIQGLHEAAKTGFLSEGELKAVRRSVKWEDYELAKKKNEKVESWSRAAAFACAENDEFQMLSIYAIDSMITTLTNYVEVNPNQGANKGDSITFWVPEAEGKNND